MAKGDWIGHYATRTDPNRHGSPGGKYRAWATRMRERAGGKCEQCGRVAKLELHHHDESKHNQIVPDNEVSALCRSCHKKKHQ